MRELSFRPIAILALNAGSEEHERAILAANGFNANKPLVGVYKGQEERSWLVALSDTEDARAKLVELAAAYDQESVLFSGMDRYSVLHYVEDGREEQLGVLRAVPAGVAKGKDCYTFDPVSGEYFIA